MNKFKTNFGIRARNPHFWAQMVASIFMPILVYYGVTAEQITSWGTLFKLVRDAVSNPYVLATIGASAYNAYVDNTTPEFGDSVRALSYKKTKA
ncbi:phage holin [Staphylococcus delphini]|uniref:phage holin n=1 Tax=Staphylococcus delphini TaxID=53344 RepID=UPI003365277D